MFIIDEPQPGSATALPGHESEMLEGVIDRSMKFIPEWITPLAHTPVYQQLSDSQRLRYNQLYAVYFNEQIAFFETVMAQNILSAALMLALPEKMKQGLLQFIEDERRHTILFHELNKKAAPELYSNGPHYFVRMPRFWRIVSGWSTRRPSLFPMYLWLMILQEERAMYYARSFIEHEDQIEPHFLEVHRRHMVDEARHVHWDEKLLTMLWNRSGGFKRWMNAKLFIWMVGEYFNLPKRAGMQLLDQLAQEDQSLRPRLPDLKGQIRALYLNPEYHHRLYSREIVPRTFSLFDAWPEFAALGRVLQGYRPCRDSTSWPIAKTTPSQQN